VSSGLEVEAAALGAGLGARRSRRAHGERVLLLFGVCLGGTPVDSHLTYSSMGIRHSYVLVVVGVFRYVYMIC